jgi:hypothetical protein
MSFPLSLLAVDTTEDIELIISRSLRDCETDAGRRGV